MAFLLQRWGSLSRPLLKSPSAAFKTEKKEKRIDRSNKRELFIFEQLSNKLHISNPMTAPILSPHFSPLGFFLLVILFVVVPYSDAQQGFRYAPNRTPRRIVSTRLISRVANKDCQKYTFYRSYDGICTNPINPTAGSSGTPLVSYFRNHDASKMNGKNLRAARDISNIVCSQPFDNVFDNKYRLREFATFFGQFLDHSIVLSSNDLKTPSSDQDIPVDHKTDFRCDKDFIQFNRNVKANVQGNTFGPGPKHAINVLPHAVDLFGVYGNGRLSAKLRAKQKGLMRVSDDGLNLLPLNDYRIDEPDAAANAPKGQNPTGRARFFIAGDTRSNENPQLTVFHVLFLRHHNYIAKLLADHFPNMNDDNKLFENARRVNTALFQAIVYEEYLPAMLGSALPPCPVVGSFTQCFKQGIEPTISDLFSAAAFRVGHTMVGNKVHRGPQPDSSSVHLRLKNAFFLTAERLQKDGVEPYLRGILSHLAQKIDNQVVDDLQNALFENTAGEEGFDLAAINIQRGRDSNLPSFAAIKKHFLGITVTSFADISSDRIVQSRLKDAYGLPHLVEAWPGLISEDHAPGKAMGPTMIEIWKQEFTRLREGDHYFYQNFQNYPPELKSFPYLENILNRKGDKMRDVIIKNSKLTASDVPINIWRDIQS